MWNRSAILELLEAELARARRGSPTCVVMVDADYFKSVNDMHGHAAGDAVLVELATRLRRAVRGFDLIGRYGGEEFVAILSNCTPEGAWTVCERIRRYVADDYIETPVGRLTVTVSIGVAAHGSQSDTLERVIADADAALYRAKEHGRNRVEMAWAVCNDALAQTQPLTISGPLKP